MAHLIVAMCKNGGIGIRNRIPWKCKSELNLFRKKTMNKILVTGRKTAQSIPELKGRNVICVSRNNYNTTKWINKPQVINSISDIRKFDNWKHKVFIAGGAEIYKAALTHKDKLVDTVHLSVMNEEYEADTFFDKNLLTNFVITNEVIHKEFAQYTLDRTSNGEHQYLSLLDDITNNGVERIGRNGITKSLFAKHLTFDLRNGFPLLTTKKMFMKGIVEEFLFFMRGDTDSTILSDKKVRIWEGNTSSKFIKSLGLPYAQGVMGPMYGYQWRSFGKPYDIDTNGLPTSSGIGSYRGIDQLQNVIDLIQNDPYSRRILMTTYNPQQAEEGVLYPCHSIVVQFNVDGDNLDMFCYNRSNDALLGIPFNIASSSLLLIMVAQLTGKTPRHFSMSIGDVHIYDEHTESVDLQLSRIPYEFPSLCIPEINSLDDIYSIDSNDFELIDYKSHKSIKAPMIA